MTGGAGFIGSHLTDRLIKEGCRVVVIDNLSTGKKENLNSKAKFYKTDICRPEIARIFKKEKPEAVFHYAAHTEARQSLEDPVSDARENILNSINVLESCRKAGVKRIVFASSGGEIYGNAREIPTSELYHPFPLSPYGVAKFSVERYLNSYLKIFKLPFASLRYGNVYGPRQNPQGEAGVVAIFTAKMLKNEQPLIHGTGEQTKDYIFIDDAIDATVLSFKKGFVGILNVGSGKETSVLEIFDRIRGLTRSSVKEKHAPFPLIGFPRACLSTKKAKKELNWQPKHSLEDGLKETCGWFGKKISKGKR